MFGCEHGRLPVQSRTSRSAGATYAGRMIAPNATVYPSRLVRAREIVTDLLLATAIIWALPLLLGAGAGLIRLLVM
jgi:hypothetical protein